jgi:hypothetical protein
VAGEGKARGLLERAALVPQGISVPNPWLLERCRGRKLKRAPSGAVCGRGSDRVPRSSESLSGASPEGAREAKRGVDASDGLRARGVDGKPEASEKASRERSTSTAATVHAQDL